MRHLFKRLLLLLLIVCQLTHSSFFTPLKSKTVFAQSLQKSQLTPYLLRNPILPNLGQVIPQSNSLRTQRQKFFENHPFVQLKTSSIQYREYAVPGSSQPILMKEGNPEKYKNEAFIVIPGKQLFLLSVPLYSIIPFIKGYKKHYWDENFDKDELLWLLAQEGYDVLFLPTVELSKDWNVAKRWVKGKRFKNATIDSLTANPETVGESFIQPALNEIFNPDSEIGKILPDKISWLATSAGAQPTAYLLARDNFLINRLDKIVFYNPAFQLVPSLNKFLTAYLVERLLWRIFVPPERHEQGMLNDMFNGLKASQWLKEIAKKKAENPAFPHIAFIATRQDQGSLADELGEDDVPRIVKSIMDSLLRPHRFGTQYTDAYVVFQKAIGMTFIREFVEAAVNKSFFVQTEPETLAKPWSSYRLKVANTTGEIFSIGAWGIPHAFSRTGNFLILNVLKKMETKFSSQVSRSKEIFDLWGHFNLLSPDMEEKEVKKILVAADKKETNVVDQSIYFRATKVLTSSISFIGIFLVLEFIIGPKVHLSLLDLYKKYYATFLNENIEFGSLMMGGIFSFFGLLFELTEAYLTNNNKRIFRLYSNFPKHILLHTLASAFLVFGLYYIHIYPMPFIAFQVFISMSINALVSVLVLQIVYGLTHFKQFFREYTSSRDILKSFRLKLKNYIPHLLVLLPFQLIQHYVAQMYLFENFSIQMLFIIATNFYTNLYLSWLINQTNPQLSKSNYLPIGFFSSVIAFMMGAYWILPPTLLLTSLLLWLDIRPDLYWKDGKQFVKPFIRLKKRQFKKSLQGYKDSSFYLTEFLKILFSNKSNHDLLDLYDILKELQIPNKMIRRIIYDFRKNMFVKKKSLSKKPYQNLHEELLAYLNDQTIEDESLRHNAREYLLAYFNQQMGRQLRETYQGLSNYEKWQRVQKNAASFKGVFIAADSQAMSPFEKSHLPYYLNELCKKGKSIGLITTGPINNYVRQHLDENHHNRCEFYGINTVRWLSLLRFANHFQLDISEILIISFNKNSRSVFLGPNSFYLGKLSIKNQPNVIRTLDIQLSSGFDGFSKLINKLFLTNETQATFPNVNMGKEIQKGYLVSA